MEKSFRNLPCNCGPLVRGGQELGQGLLPAACLREGQGIWKKRLCQGVKPVIPLILSINQFLKQCIYISKNAEMTGVLLGQGGRKGELYSSASL